MESIFGQLHRWASRQSENFVTQSLVVVLSSILEHEPEHGLRAVDFLGGLNFTEDAARGSAPSITTQFGTQFGRPDIWIQTDRKLALIEVKVDSPLSVDQLSRYRKILLESGKSEVQLVLLAKHRIQEIGSGDEHYNFLRWQDVAAKLSELALANSVTKFLRDQFVQFLRENRMAEEKVDWHLEEGVKSLLTLMAMLDDELRRRKLVVRVASASAYHGKYLFESGNRFFFGCYLADSQKLLFEISNIPKEDWDRIRNIDLGDHELLRAEQSWHFFTDLSSEDAHFFARSAASQSRFIGEFVDAAMAQAKERRLLPE